MKGRTPNEFIEKEGSKSLLLKKEFELPKGPIPIEDRAIHIVRFIRSDRILNIFGEHFQMPKDVVYEYVIGTILTEIHSLKVTCNGKLVDFFEYRLPSGISIEKTIKELAFYLKDLGILNLL